MSDDLIKRSDAIAELWDMTTEDCPNPGAAVGKCMEAIRHLPSADRPQGYDVDGIEDFMPEAKAWITDAPSIEIVRCKECKYAHMTYGGECKYCDKWSLEDSLYLDGDFFCSYGERSE